MAYDMHIEGLPVSLVRGFRFLSFGDYPTPIGVQGIQKMVDRYLKCLCTPKGTDITDPEYGTTLMSLLGGNVDKTTLNQVAILAASEAADKIQEYDVENGTVAEERLAGAEIENVYLDSAGTQVEIFILLTNSEGTTVRVLVPHYEQVARRSVQTE